MKTQEKIANEVIKLFMNNKLEVQEQLEVLEITREKIMWCRKVALELMKK